MKSLKTRSPTAKPSAYETNGGLIEPSLVLAAYLDTHPNLNPQRIESMRIYTNRFVGFWLKQVEVEGLGWERFYWSPQSEELAKKYAATPTDFPPIILCPPGLVHDGARRVRAAELRGDELIWAYVPVGEAAPLA